MVAVLTKKGDVVKQDKHKGFVVCVCCCVVFLIESRVVTFMLLLNLVFAFGLFVLFCLFMCDCCHH